MMLVTFTCKRQQKIYVKILHKEMSYLVNVSSCCFFFIQNKRPMGHIAHLRNQFKSINTFELSYDYIYYKTVPVVQEENIL